MNFPSPNSSGTIVRQPHFSLWLAFILLLSSGWTERLPAAETPALGSPTRMAICDLLRERFVRDNQESLDLDGYVEFTDVHLKIENGWACFSGDPRYRDGKGDDFFPSVLALLKGNGVKWQVVKVMYVTDVPARDDLTGGRDVPGSIFPSYIK